MLSSLMDPERVDAEKVGVRKQIKLWEINQGQKTEVDYCLGGRLELYSASSLFFTVSHDS